MIKIPKCPKCGSDTAPDLVEINVLEEPTRSTYEEVYECKCGCCFVALIPRDNMISNAIIHQTIRNGNVERWV